MWYAYDTHQTQICSPGTKLIRIHTQDADIVLSGWTISRSSMGRGYSGEAHVVDRGSLRSGWLQTGLVVSGYALVCTDVRPRVDNYSIVLIKKGSLPRAQGCSGFSFV